MTKLTTEQIKRQKALAWLKRVAYETPCMKEVKTCIEVLSAPAQPAMPVQEIVGWIFEDELPKNYPYDTMFVHSKVDVVRMFPVFSPSSAQPVIPEQTERERIRREHAEWSDATFGNVGPVGPLKHLSKEALEAAADPSDPLEWADMQFLLWDAQRRMGISDEFITRAMIEKLEINKSRQWPEPKDGEPRLHVKQPQNAQQNIPENIPAQPVSNPYKFLDERAKYRVIIEGFSNSRSVDFEACSQEEAEEIGRDIFHEECNYGVERLESIPAQESE